MRIATLFAFGLASLPALAAEGDDLEVETDRLVAATAALFDVIEGGEKTPGIVAPGPVAIPATLEVDGIARAESAFRADLGPVSDLTAYRISWYPVDGLLGAVDFVGTWGSGGHLVCGYLVWDMQGDAPALDRIETTYLESSQLMAVDWAERETMLLSANCAHPDVGANFDLVGRP